MKPPVCFKWVICFLLLSSCSKDPVIFTDPMSSLQWYLRGDENHPHFVHLNLNNISYTGKDISIALIDDGADIYHEDLTHRFTGDNHSYTPEGMKSFAGQHGTACAGIIGATAHNGIGIEGIAPEANLIAYNALQAPSVQNLANALTRNIENISVSNNSWGDFNSWGEPFALRSAIEQAFILGANKGRHGLGTIYVFAAGNGGLPNEDEIAIDNVNYSGYVNNRYTIPVCAVGADGVRAPYSEIGATLVVCAPSSSSPQLPRIFTTDASEQAGYNPKSERADNSNINYTANFGGTSAATPMVSGIVALMLEANPKMSWRDVKKVLALTAQKIDFASKDWVQNSAGLWVNHEYGFGLIDAEKAIEMAEQWTNLPLEKTVEYGVQVEQTIPDNDGNSITSTINIPDNLSIEFIDIYFDAPSHPKIGDLRVELTCPSGTQSVLALRHHETFPVFRYKQWRFGSMRCLDESSKGVWTLKVIDEVSGAQGVFKSWKLKIYGTEF